MSARCAPVRADVTAAATTRPAEALNEGARGRGHFGLPAALRELRSSPLNDAATATVPPFPVALRARITVPPARPSAVKELFITICSCSIQARDCPGRDRT